MITTLYRRISSLISPPPSAEGSTKRRASRKWFTAAAVILIAALVVDVAFIALRKDRSVVVSKPASLPDVADLQQLRSLVRQEPNDAALRLTLGDAYLHFKHYVSAKEEYEQALSSGANEWAARSGLARVAIALSRYDVAQEQLQKLIALRPSSFETYLTLSEVRLLADDNKGAVQALDQIPRDAQGYPVSADSKESPLDRLDLLATAYGHAERWDTARDLMKRAVAADPKRTSSKVLLGKALHSSGQKAEAIPYLETGVKPGPGTAEIYYLLGTAYLARHGKLDDERALYSLRTAVGLDDKHGAATLALAQVLDRRGYKKAAAFGYSRAHHLGMEGGTPLLRSGDLLLASGDREEGWYRRGLYYESSGRPDLALAEYRKLTTLHDCCRSGYIHMARAYSAMGKAADAITYLKKAQQLEPGRAAELDWKLMEAYSTTKEDAKSTAILRALAAKSDKIAIEAKFQLSKTSQAAGNYADAERWLRECIQAQPEDPVFLLELSRILLEQRGDAVKLHEATTKLEKAVKLAPDYFDSMYALGQAYGYEGRVDEAIVTLRHAIDLRPENGDVYQSLAQALLRDKRKTEAAEMIALFRRFQEFREARDNLAARCKRDPRNPESQLRMAEFHMNAREYPAAIGRYRKVIALRPTDRFARARLAEALGYVGRREEQKVELAALSGGAGAAPEATPGATPPSTPRTTSGLTQ